MGNLTRIRFLFVLLVGMLMLPNGSYGTSMAPLPADGTLLLRQCQTTIEVMDAGVNAPEKDILPAQFCGDYIRGYSDALIAAKGICVGADVSNGTMVRVYSSFMRHHPEFLKRYQGEGVRAALELNYSCDKRAPG